MTTKQVVAELRRRQGAGTQSQLALKIGCTEAYLSHVLNGRRNPGPKMLRFLGIPHVKTERVYSRE